MTTSQKPTKRYFQDLDISTTGQPTGIDEIRAITAEGTCYCIIKNNDAVQQVDVYKDGKKVHYKKFGYDKKGRVVKNMMYTPDHQGNRTGQRSITITPDQFTDFHEMV